MPEEYYFISDLHIGGDGKLDICEFEPELISFLQFLEKQTKSTELIIVGDTFALWEMTEKKGVSKLGTIIKNHKALFEQFRKTGKNIRITIIPGNHDNELVRYAGFARLLRKYNINLIKKIRIIRKINGTKIYIEHGSQNDTFNRFDNFMNPKEPPIGYYATRKITRNASKFSEFGKHSWLKEIESVYPNEEIPKWLFSNYFYREMNPFLRLTMLPFLLFFGASFILLLGLLVESTGILKTHLFSRQTLDSLWIIGDILSIIIIVNIAIIIILLIFSVPLLLIIKDIKRTMARYRLPNDYLKLQKEQVYINSAKRILRSSPNTSIYIFGHNHWPYLKRIDKKHVIINTGTWLKRLTKLPTRFFLLPSVYYSSYRLNYFKIAKKGSRIHIAYRIIRKKHRPDLTWLQRFAILTKRKSDRIKIPKDTYLET
jgi:UDP-2,3-diacylglucosamine pyrophosphatase LpxH